jgi:hypothetical protein
MTILSRGAGPRSGPYPFDALDRALVAGLPPRSWNLDLGNAK